MIISINCRIVFDVTNERTGAVGHIKRRWDTWLRQLVMFVLSLLLIVHQC